MKVDKTIKRKVTKEWLNAFPQLSAFNPNKLYKLVGPCVIGIELIKSPIKVNYSPYFVMYSLCGNRMGNDIRASLAGPILLKPYYNRKGFEYDIPYDKPDVIFDDVINSVRQQTPLPFDGNISLKKLISTLDEYSQIPPLSAAPNSYLQATLQEAKLKIALFISSEEACNVFEQIKKRNWDINHFKAFGENIKEWLHGLWEIMGNREELLKQIETNKHDKKIVKLKSSELTE